MNAYDLHKHIHMVSDHAGAEERPDPPGYVWCLERDCIHINSLKKDRAEAMCVHDVLLHVHCPP